MSHIRTTEELKRYKSEIAEIAIAALVKGIDEPHDTWCGFELSNGLTFDCHFYRDESPQIIWAYGTYFDGKYTSVNTDVELEIFRGELVHCLKCDNVFAENVNKPIDTCTHCGNVDMQETVYLQSE